MAETPLAPAIPDDPVGASVPGRHRTWNASLIAGVIMMAIVVLVAILAPLLFWESAANLNAGAANLGPSSSHLFGTDGRGHDMLARSLVALRITLIMAAIATAIAVVSGLTIGVALWVAPRRIREPGLRLIEMVIAYPGLLVALVIAAILGKGTVPVVIAIGIAGIAGFARITANLAASLSQREFVSTARLLGVPARMLAIRHVIPNMAEPLLILISQSFAISLIDIAGLSFVGLGVQEPNFDLGTMLSDALQSVRIFPTRVIAPAAVIVFASLAALFIGDGLAAMANPRSAGKRSRMRRSTEMSSAREPGDATALLTVRDVVVTHAETGTQLVKGVSFTIGRGEILGIVGESGSGKSLTASVVSKLLAEGLEATAGQLTLGDMDLLEKVPPRELATSIGLVYQDPGTALNPALTLGSQLSDVLRTHLGMNRRGARQTILDGFRSVLLDDPEGRLGQRPHELSGGMKQRAMISSAMNTQPVLLIADEPTTALDVTVQQEVLRIIRRMSTQSNTAVLFISHDIGVVRALCDRVIVMKDGEIVERVDDTAHLDVDHVTHPYTRQLLAATPRVTVTEIVEPAVDDTHGDGLSPAGGPLLDVVDLDVAFGKAQILHKVNVQLARGRTLGVVGESGSGKSTLAAAIVGTVKPRAGTVDSAGVNVGSASSHELADYRRRVQLIPQDPYSSLSPRRTIGESIAEALDPVKASVSAHRDRIAVWLERVGLEADMMYRYPHEFSGGQRQRIAIARGLILEPDLVIADEITSALDVSVQAQILELMAEIKAEMSLTMVFISHNLAVVQQVSDDILVLYHGRVVEAGPADRIYAAPAHWYTKQLLASNPGSPEFSLD